MSSDGFAELRIPLFWHGMLASLFANVGLGFPDEALARSLGTSMESALAWWDDFTGFGAASLDESDGYVLDPTRFDLPFSSDVTIAIEYHPGGTIYRLARREEQAVLCEMGPHWKLPGLRWEEVEALSRAIRDVGGVGQAEALLLLLPTYWPESTGAIPDNERAVRAALEVLGLTAPRGSELLAGAWADLIRGVADVHWSEGPRGVTNDIQQSTRGLVAEPADVALINDLVTVAAGYEGFR